VQTIGTQVLSTTYDYNPFTGNLQALTLPSGHAVSYTWVGGRINAIAVDGQTQVSGIAYQPFGAAKSWASATVKPAAAATPSEQSGSQNNRGPE